MHGCMLGGAFGPEAGCTVAMRIRRTPRLALSVGGGSIALMVGGLALMFVDRHAAMPSDASSAAWTVPNVLNVSVTIAGVAIGTLLAYRRPDNRIGWLFIAAGVAFALNTFGTAYGVRALVIDPGSLPAGRPVAWLANSTGIIPSLMLTAIFLLFPTGRLPSRRWRPVAWVIGAAVGATTVLVAVFATLGWSHPFRAQPGGGPILTLVFVLLFIFPLVASFVGSIASLIVRFLGSVGDERLQLKWFAAAAVLVMATFIAAFSSGSSSPPPLISLLQSAAFVLLYAAIAVAVLKYRLYEIDVVINRAVVYGMLALFITVVYVSLVVGVGTLVGDRGSALLSAVAAAVIAVLFQPVQQRSRRLANRVVYGKRATPYEVLSDFAERVAGTFGVDDVLPRTARMLAEGTGAVRADVWIVVGPELRAAGSWPSAEVERVGLGPGGTVDVPGATVTVPVRYQGELLGALSLWKAPGYPLTSTDEKLLSDVASQAGLVLRNARLIEDLRASRQRLVAAQDEERRKLERNIHDGAQQQLVALAVKARLAEQVGSRDPERGQALLREVQEGLGEALEDLRDLARGIYPPLLADKGLAAAIEAQTRKAVLPVEVAADGIGRYRQETEAAVYFSVLEGLQNVAKYAHASRAIVRLAQSNGTLLFEVSDDGDGFDAGATAYGTGLQGIADRLAALDGRLDISSRPGEGTTVVGALPV
jgi:signal transduction histidine kinase